VVGGTPRAAMSARLITGRPLIAGIGATSSRSRVRLRHGKRPPARACPRADPGILALRAGQFSMVASPCLLQFGQVSRCLMPVSGGCSGASRGQAADGTFAEALSAVPPFGAGLLAAV
jgi:hypothetical protein